MIKGFVDDVTELAFKGAFHKRLPSDIRVAARRKLALLHAAVDIEQLRIPPGNRLEKLSGDRAGQWSIRVNDPWRLCFRWDGMHAHEVELVDYHH